MTKTKIICRKITKLNNLIIGMTRACGIIDPNHTQELVSAIHETKNTITLIDMQLKPAYGKEFKTMPEDEYHTVIDTLDTAYARCINIRFPYEYTLFPARSTT